jgi:hypothetical protein
VSNERLTVAQVIWLAAYATGMAAGQILFKLAAQRLGSSGTAAERLIELAGNAYLYAAFALYRSILLRPNGFGVLSERRS